jgi:hypothetical protein
MAIDKLDHNCWVGKETTPQKFTFMTCLFYINPCYQLRLIDGLLRTVDVIWNITHFKHFNAKKKQQKIKKKIPDSFRWYHHSGKQ